MKKYTIGALFTPDLKQILLIKKNRPEWQKGKLNLPGGHIEEGETGAECIAREFIEEAGCIIPEQDWCVIGKIKNEGNYYVDFFTTIYFEDLHGKINFNASDEEIMWCDTDSLPDNVLSNLYWLIPFAINIHRQGNADGLVFGEFEYKY